MRARPTEEREPESAVDLVGRADAGVERLPQERQPDAEQEPERGSEQAVSHGLRLDLGGVVGRDDVRGLRLERLGRRQQGRVVDETLVQLRVLLSRRLELGLTVAELGYALKLDAVEIELIESGLSDLCTCREFEDAFDEFEERIFATFAGA